MVLDIPPIRPVSMPRSTPPMGGVFGGGGKPKSAFDKLDVSKIGHGRLLREGSYTKRLGVGLRGQLKELQLRGRHGSTANLSNKNIEQIHDLIDDRIKGHDLGSKTFLSNRDERKILGEARKLAHTEGSGFSMEDRKDLKKIVDTLREEFSDQILHHDNNHDNMSNHPSVTSHTPLHIPLAPEDTETISNSH